MARMCNQTLLVRVVGGYILPVTLDRGSLGSLGSLDLLDLDTVQETGPDPGEGEE